SPVASNSGGGCPPAVRTGLGLFRGHAKPGVRPGFAAPDGKAMPRAAIFRQTACGYWSYQHCLAAEWAADEVVHDEMGAVPVAQVLVCLFHCLDNHSIDQQAGVGNMAEAWKRLPAAVETARLAVSESPFRSTARSRCCLFTDLEPARPRVTAVDRT